MSQFKKDVATVLNDVHIKMGIIEKPRKPTMQIEKHTSKSFDQDLKDASDLFFRMGEVVTNQVAQAVHALTDSDIELATKVIKDDRDVNEMERQLDEMIMQIVVMRQPTANDFRVVFAMSKGVVDLERIGDEATKIAKMALELAEEGSSPIGYSEVQHLSNQVRLMVHEALEASQNFDAEQAFEVMRSDNAINREYQSATRALMTYIMEDSHHVTKVINIMWVLRALERIGAHAKNIAEQVIYISSGMDVKHTDYEQVEQAVQEANQKAASYQDKDSYQAKDSNQDSKGDE